ncbi:MAG TPA: hypothetical protein VMG34_03590 [Bacteroidota bacterium]|nr:hypothetical protein [Bacteroidota bacterium]
MTREERIKGLTELLAKDPGDAFSRYALAVEYEALGDKMKAAAELRLVLEHDQSYIAAYRLLGKIHAGLNRTKEAKEFYRKGIELAEKMNDAHAREEMEEELEDIEDEW